MENWVDFYYWVSRKDVNKEYTQSPKGEQITDFKTLIDNLKAKWSAEFGSLTKITNFVSIMMKSQEKRELVKSIRYMQKVTALPPQK